MIPVRLEFSAFGPFPEKQVVDFTKFDDDRLFLITGPTGSGKTTIFDALTFSLYGEASGSLREKTTLKSDFVGENGLCYASFTFLIHGTQYTVRRMPQQRCPKQRGQGYKDQPADAVLSDENGVICTHIGPVNQKIEELIGLNSEQFHKIVLLPQGEFRRFLSDKSDAKQEILRHIFSTDTLRIFTERLKENVSSLTAEYQDILSQCSAFLHTIQADSDCMLSRLTASDTPDFRAILTALTEQNEKDAQHLKQTKNQFMQASAAYDSINLDLAKTENTLLAQCRKARDEFKEMERHNAEWAERRKLLEALEKAEPVAQKEQEYKELEHEIISLTQSIEKAKCALALKNNAFISAHAEYEDAKKNADSAAEKNKQIPILEAQLKKYKELEMKEKECADLKEQLKKQERIQKTLSSAMLWFTAKEALDAVLKKKQTSERFFDTLHAYQSACVAAAASANDAAAALSHYIAAQAPFLAEKLRDHEPCPVCGSTIHPAPARHGSALGSKVQYERLKQAETEAVRKRERLFQELSQYLSDENAGKDPLTCTASEEKIYRALCKEYTDRRQELSSFQISKTLQALSFDELRTQADGCSQECQQMQGRLSAVIEQQALLAAELPDNMTAPVLADRILLLKQQNENALKDLQKAVDTLHDARLSVVRTQEQLEIFTKQLEEKRVLFKRKESDFMQLMQEASITEKKYRSLLSFLPELPNRREALQRYKIEYRTKRNALQRLEEQTADLKEHDLNQMTKRKQDAQDVRDALQKEYNRNAQRLHANQAAAESLTACIKEEETKRRSLEQARFLYEVARGDYSGKVNFERYVLAYYFENVIRTANLRLEQITNSRYTLVRRSQSKGNRTAGLDLDIFDAYTGISRNVDTLSGGESFKVALSLALGLADTISESSGGIELNTMLIDEGFGSLDSESLDAAINCLYSLRADGRYIGIISHVNELKERIPQQIRVIPGINGSTIEEDAL